MSITINFRNRNIDALDEIRIYRTESRDVPATLIATLTNDKVFYKDTTALYNRLYYYQTGAVYQGIENRSTLFPAMSFRNDDSGPGPKTFLRGNHEFGLMGEVDLVELPTFDAVASASAVARNVSTSPTKALKWCINGKIIYTFNAPYHSGISKDNLKKLFIAANKESEYFSIGFGAYNFKVRPPFATTLRGAIVGTGETYPLAWTPDVQNSECGAILRSYLSTAAIKAGEQVMDLTPTPAGGLWTNTYYDLNTYYMFYFDGNTSAVRASSGTAPFYPVYELLLD
ncbi:hypothetical protein NFI00_000177 [Salmonella enterica]|nr:hypothetical protein [Salmonella enterica]